MLPFSYLLQTQQQAHINTVQVTRVSYFVSKYGREASESMYKNCDKVFGCNSYLLSYSY